MKCGVSIVRRGHLLSTLLLGVTLASPALGAPIEVFFDGPVVGGEHRGLDLGSLPGGVPVRNFPLFSVVGSLDVVRQSADGTVFTAGTVLPPGPITVTSQWVIQAEPGFLGAVGGEQVYLMFAQQLNAPVLGTGGAQLGVTNYDTDFTDDLLGTDAMPDDNAGLVIDADTGWIVVQATDDVNQVPTVFSYVGVPLDFSQTGADCGGQSLAAEQACVAVTYFLENPNDNLFPEGQDVILGLPEFQILMAVVPEPGTGSLLALGLVALAAGRRRRS